MYIYERIFYKIKFMPEFSKFFRCSDIHFLVISDSPRALMLLLWLQARSNIIIRWVLRSKGSKKGQVGIQMWGNIKKHSWEQIYMNVIQGVLDKIKDYSSKQIIILTDTPCTFKLIQSVLYCIGRHQNYKPQVKICSQTLIFFNEKLFHGAKFMLP